jgi:hypothetical protein
MAVFINLVPRAFPFLSLGRREKALAPGGHMTFNTHPRPQAQARAALTVALVQAVEQLIMIGSFAGGKEMRVNNKQWLARRVAIIYINWY